MFELIYPAWVLIEHIDLLRCDVANCINFDSLCLANAHGRDDRVPYRMRGS